MAIRQGTRARLWVCFAVAAALTSPPSDSRAQPTAPSAVPAGDNGESGADVIVATVGNTKISAQELDRRLSKIPPFQLRAFGETPEEIRRGYLDQVLVREVLFAEEAKARKLSERADLRDRTNAVLRNALLDDLRGEMRDDNPIEATDVRAFYEKNIASFKSPQRVLLWRILVESKPEAQTIIDELKSDLTTVTWKKIAEEKSVDKSSSMRGGNLGFIASDGSSSQKGVKVDPGVYRAAMDVADLELVPVPVAERDRFAVVWRRQTMKAVTRSIDTEEAQIRKELGRIRAQETLSGLLKSLREENLSGTSSELVDQIEVAPVTGDISRGKRPGVLPKTQRNAANPVPTEGPDGLR